MDLGAGPSPRLRGKPTGGGNGLAGRGSIPAPAGKTPRARPRGSPQRVHPRACGENLGFQHRARACDGPSPRLRGKHRANPRVSSLPGSIPAPAGKTFLRRSLSICDSVHPRACGENFRVSVRPYWREGPSPRLRGKLSVSDLRQGAGGSIPAPAGKTDPAGCVVGTGQVHPRACGENEDSEWVSMGSSGPSPRLRGKP